jgi:hypothetical protein
MKGLCSVGMSLGAAVVSAALLNAQDKPTMQPLRPATAQTVISEPRIQQVLRGDQIRDLPPRGACDKSCLTGIADAYFAALVAHDPSKAPMAPRAKFTEQTKQLAVGEGLWKTITEGPTTFKIYVPDPVVGQLGAIVVLKDAGKPVQMGLRLKIVNRQITEAEHLIWTNVNATSMANLEKPRPGLLAAVPPADRLPREVMLLYGHGYYDSLEQSDGKAVPFADDCVRHEGGMHTAGPRAAVAPSAGSAAPGARATAAPTGGGVSGQPAGGRAATSANASDFGSMTCAGQLDTRFMSYIERIDLRRVWIADPETGLVFGLSMFRHPMTEKVLQLVMPDGTRSQRDMTTQRQFDMAAVHIFKIRDGKIHEIEATGYVLPFMSPNGWSEFLR